jgi:truncated hemoglobin YjbI
MKLHGSVARAALLIATVVAILSGCSKAATNQMESSAMTAGAAGATAAGQSLLGQLGGMSGVSKLAEAFSGNMTKDPVLSKLLDPATITQTSNGLVNSIATMSGQKPPHGSDDMLKALSGKNLGADGVNALTGALSSAADQMKVVEPTKSALMAVLTPVTNSLLGK